jgi:hypothetical protein
MSPKRRGGPARAAGTENASPVDTGDSPVPAFFETASGDENAPTEPPAGDASFEEESVALQQPALEAAAPTDADTPMASALERHEEIVEPGAAPETGAGETALAPLDDAVSASASLIGSVAGGIGLASIVGGGMVVIGLGAAVGAWYSVALANNYLKRRWETGRSGAA